MLTVEELIQKDITGSVRVSIEDNKNGKVVAAFAAGREGSGCTKTLYEMGYFIASHSPDRSVCIVDLNLAEPCMDSFFVTNPQTIQMHLDNLYSQITDEITKNVIDSNTFNKKDRPNLFLLPGTRRPFSSDSFNAEVLMGVIAAVRHMFDIVLVDMSSHFDNPGTIAGLHAADEILAISNYDEDGLRFFNLYFNTLLSPHPIAEKVKVLGVNSRNVTTEDLTFLTSCPVLGELAFLNGSGKSKDRYYNQLTEVISKLNIGLTQTNVERRKLRVWPILR